MDPPGFAREINVMKSSVWNKDLTTRCPDLELIN